MKKKNEIEEEILDEEVLEDEEILDEDDDVVEDDEVIDDEVIDEEDEKPAKAKKAKAAKKGGKKKLSTGAKVGISIGSVVAFLAIAVVLVVWVIMPMLSAKLENASYQGLIGNTKPTNVTTVEEVNSSMTSYEMLQAALKNYDEAEYAANICLVGGVSTKVAIINVNQAVQSLKIRDGKATDDDVKYFARSVSFSAITKMGEEYYTKGLSSKPIQYRRTVDITAKGKIKSWEPVQSFADLDAFIEEKTTDFTKIWSYEVTNKTVTKDSLSSKPRYDKKEGCYYLTVAVDVSNEEAIAGYKKVMEYQLSKNMNATVNELTFTALSFDIAIWDNGFIRYIGINEAYNMNLVLGDFEVPGINISNAYMNEYSYDPTEKIPYGDKTLDKDEFFKLF